jgi:adenosine kinase
MNIVCTGSVAYDYLMTFPGYFKDQIIPEHLDSISLSFLVDSMVRQRGGVATNIAYNLALLGEKPIVLATVGQDFDEYRLWLESKGVDTQYIKVIEGEYTASFFANTDLANAQIASFYTGAMAHAAELSLKILPKEESELVIISPNDPEAMHKYVMECKEDQRSYMYDPSQQLARLKVEEICAGVQGANSVFVNDYEIELLQKHTGFSLSDLLKQVQLLVVTCGKDGASIYADDTLYQIPVVQPNQVLDPTGVGDAFRGGFLKGMAMKLDWQTCGQMGALAATYCLEHRGTQNHTYSKQDFVHRYRLHFDDQGVLDTLI